MQLGEPDGVEAPSLSCIHQLEASVKRSCLAYSRRALELVGVTQRTPVARLRSAIEQIRALLAGDTLQYRPYRRAIPITLGTWGRRTAELAGELADEIKIGGSANAAMATHLRPAIAAG